MSKYDDQFRASAVLYLKTAGYPDTRGALTRVANKLNVPARTLSRWFNKESNPPPDQIVNEKRFDLIQAIKQEIAAAFGEMEDARSEASYKDLTTSAAILVDKLQLLEGKPTAIVKLQRAIESGRIPLDVAKTRWPTLFEQLENVRTAD